VTAAEVPLAWLAAEPAVTSAILGARNSEQLAATLKAAELKLTADEVAGLSEVSAPAFSDYPYGKGGVAQCRRKIEGAREAGFGQSL